MGNKLDIQAAKARCEAAMPGPWTIGQDGPDVKVMSGQIVIAEMGDFYPEVHFVAHARSDLPAALEALEEAQRKNTEIAEANMDVNREMQRLRDELGDYKALAEQRGEAGLVKELKARIGMCLPCKGTGTITEHPPEGGTVYSPCGTCLMSRAALATTPESVCLICGRDVPCELDINKDNDPNWPGSPCTFDPSREELDARTKTKA